MADDEDLNLPDAALATMLGKVTPDSLMKTSQSLAHTLLDDEHLIKLSKIKEKEVDALAYGYFFAETWRWAALRTFLDTKLQLRESVQGWRAEQIKDLSKPVSIQTAPKERRRWRWPF